MTFFFDTYFKAFQNQQTSMVGDTKAHGERGLTLHMK